MQDRSTWVTTTHRWADDVDPAHLAQVRDTFGREETAGGRRHLILEVLAYADDEAGSQGRIGLVTVTVHPTGWVSVADDGRGTDTRRDSEGRIVRKPVMATADVRFTDSSTAPLLPDGLPRRGMSTVAALSTILVHENHRVEGSWSQTYRHGIPESDLETLPAREASGTTVTFAADLLGPTELVDRDLRAFPNLTIIVRR